MPSLKAIRARISTVKNTQKITRAMKMVAAARLRRAQEAIIGARPYTRALEEVIAEVALRAGEESHPLLEVRPEKKVLLIAITSDRGLAGASNTNVNRAIERFHYERKGTLEQIQLIVLGRKGRDYLRRRKYVIQKEIPGAAGDTAEARAEELSQLAAAAYLDKSIDAVYVIYNEFKSAMTQKTLTEKLLPITPKALPAGASPTDYVYEPNRKIVLDRLLPMYVKVELLRDLLESIASEFGARMSAMDSASTNAKQMVAKLSLDYNRARQAAITKELLEIIGGAEALKG
jgi:F-type H+-transporting ATPase subunit gamma